MKKKLLYLAAVVLLTTTVAQAQEKVLQVHSGGNVVYAANTSQIDSIIFRPAANDCIVDNPLQNIAWLKEYCDSLKEREDVSGFDVMLYKVIDTGEHIFFIWDETKHFISECYLGGEYYLTFRLNCMNCNGDTVFHWESVDGYNCLYIDDFDGMRRYAEFEKGKEPVAILLRYDKP